MGYLASGHYNFAQTASATNPTFKIQVLSSQNTPANTSAVHFNHYFYIDNFRVTTPNTSQQVVVEYKPEILETHDYYPFGMDMPGRNVVGASPYMYGHNGQEREHEEFEGAYSAEFWGYDSRLGRRWERDPITKPWESPYATFANNPIRFSDIEGLTAGEGNGDEKMPLLPDEKTAKIGDKASLESDSYKYTYTLEEDVTGTKMWIVTNVEFKKAVVVTADAPRLNTALTYQNSIPTSKNDKMFLLVTSVGAEAAFVGGINPSVKQYQLGENHLKLYSGKFMSTYETDIITGMGAGIGVDFGVGIMDDVGPWENPLDRVLNATDFDYGIDYEVFRAGYNTGDGKSYDYYSVGIGVGLMEKGRFEEIKKDMGFAPLIKQGSTGVGLFDPFVIYMDKPTFADSVRTALNNRGDSIADKFLERNPSVIPKCITCK